MCAAVVGRGDQIVLAADDDDRQVDQDVQRGQLVVRRERREEVRDDIDRRLADHARHELDQCRVGVAARTRGDVTNSQAASVKRARPRSMRLLLAAHTP